MLKPLILSSLLLLVSLATSSTAGQIFYVDNKTGSDGYDGLSPTPTPAEKSGPFATIMQAVKKATVGATISLANTGVDYRENVSIEGYKKGRAATPLVIEGNGATVSGLLPIPSERWTLLKDDIYWTENKLPDGKYGLLPNSNWLSHYRHQGWFTEKQAPEIFFVNGKTAPHTRTLESIPVGGFFYDTQASRRRLYFRLPAGKSLKDLTIDIPQNEGVYVSDDYVVVRNLRSIYSQDDGFSGFWGIGVVFENINGSFNCDQGFSVHGTSVSLVDGGLFERNGGCGICDVMSSTSIFRNCVVRDNMITGAMMMGLAHSFLNCRFSGNDSIQVMGSSGTAVQMVNCIVDGEGGGPTGVQIDAGRLDHCTIVNCRDGLSLNTGSVKNSLISDCGGSLVVASQPKSFSMSKTVLGLGIVQVGGEKVGRDKWAEFAATRGLADNFIDAPKLSAPLYRLPNDSQYLKSGEFSTTPGATLGEYRGWKPTHAVSDPYPHP
jgi:hypothetical protein